MKIFLLALACLAAACLFSQPARAAEGGVLSAPWLPWLLLLALVALGAVVAAQRLRFRQQAQATDDLAMRLHLSDQALDLAPLPILRLDAGLHVLAANQCAHQEYSRNGSPLGQGLLDLLPELAGHPTIALQADGGKEEVQETAPLDQERPEPDVLGKLVPITAQGRSLMFWFGARPAGQDQRQDPREIDVYAQQAASRMKSEFIANINHEVRTPLNAIIGYTEMLAKSQLAPKEKRFAAIIHKSSMALVSIFNDIMELSKVDSDRFQLMIAPASLQAIINDVEGLFKELAEEKGILLRCRVAGHLPEYILFDGVRLKQILQNLVGNAVKFTTEGTVSLTIDGLAAEARPGCLHLRFVVEDTGTGISEANQREIVDLFRERQKITKHFNGVGLGLTLCSRLMAMMGGRIELVSAEGQGTRFTLLFDEVQTTEPAPAAHAIPAGSPLPEGKQKKLLVVDDVDLIKDVIVDFFQSGPYQVLTANNSEEAVAMARGERPDLIFMDLNLSGADGREVTRQLRADPETAAIPVVVMTGNLLDENEYRPLFDDLLQKPFRLDRLQEMVNRYAPAAGPEPPARICSGGNGDERIPALLGSDAWSAELESLRQQAVFSGSLTDAAALGHCMRQQGLAENHTFLLRLGEELLQHAHDPDILGVDRILAKLSRTTPQSEP